MVFSFLNFSHSQNSFLKLFWTHSRLFPWLSQFSRWWSSFLFISFLHWSLSSKTFFIVGRFNSLEKKEKRLKMKQRSRANNKQQSKSFQQLYGLALLISEIYWFINPYRAMSVQTHYYSYRNHSIDALITILYSTPYLNSSSQVHILERARVEQGCVSFHFSSA